MRTGVTLDDVTRAADEILERGERPTVESVRRSLGTGSPATVNNHLTEYFRTLPKRLHLPAPIATAAADLFEKLRQTAQASADAREQAANAALEQDRARLSADRTAFEQEREALRAQATALSADLAGARDGLARLERSLEARQLENATLAARATAAESHAQAAVDERERATQNHHSEIARLKERADGNERHLLAQIEELRDQLKQARSDRDREHQQALKRQAELEKALDAATQALAGARQTLVTQDAELAHERHALEASQLALCAAREAHERETQYQQERNALVARERDEAAARVTALTAERETLTQSAAALEGRCAALQEQLVRRETQRV